MNKRVSAKVVCYFVIWYVIACGGVLQAQEHYQLSWKNEVSLLGAGAATGALGLLVKSRIQPLTETDVKLLKRSDVNLFDRQATYNWSTSLSDVSDVTLITGGAAVGLLFLGKPARNEFITIATMYIETMALATSLPSVAKGLAERNRPFVYNPAVPTESKLSKDARASFFSGHATGAFAAAAFLTTVYADYYPDSKYSPYIYSAAFGLATFTSYLRYQSGMHFQSDLWVGAIVGTTLGYLIPQLHKRAQEDEFSISPVSSSPGITLRLSF